jgi:acetate kinase
MVTNCCGLANVSDLTSDTRELIARRHHAKKWIGACTAGLGGLDTLIFSGAIGEHSPEVRAGICEGLGRVATADVITSPR